MNMYVYMTVSGCALIGSGIEWYISLLVSYFIMISTPNTGMVISMATHVEPSI